MTRKNLIMARILSTLAVLTSCFMASCTDNDLAETSGGQLLGEGEASVTVHVSVGKQGDLNATRASFSSDELALEGEMMHTLYLIVVDNATGLIEAKTDNLLYDDEGGMTEAKEYTLTVGAGEKTFYAFSNIEALECEKLDALMAKSVGEKLTDDDLTMLIPDPAGTIDIEAGHYLPMSGRTTAEAAGGDLNATNNKVEIEMVRLVSKVKLSAYALEDQYDTGDPLGIYVYFVSVDGLATSVPLFSDLVPEDEEIEYTGVVKCQFDSNDRINIAVGSNGTLTEGQKVDLHTFYVNESMKGEEADTTFGVTAFVDRGEYTFYGPTTTQVYNIERNHIVPFVLDLDSYDFAPEMTVYTAYVDGPEEVQYKADVWASFDGGWAKYFAFVKDVTSSFRIRPVMTDKKTEEPLSCEVRWTMNKVTLSYDNTSDEGTISTYDGSEQPITQADGHYFKVSGLTATSDITWAYSLVSEWTDTPEGSSRKTTHKRLYELSVHTNDIDNEPEIDLVSSAQHTPTWSNLGEQHLKMKPLMR